jgi:hypothetical protein
MDGLVVVVAIIAFCMGNIFQILIRDYEIKIKKKQK